MNDNNKKLGIVIIVIAALIIIGLAIYVYLFNKSNQPAPVNSPTNNQSQLETPTPVNTQPTIKKFDPVVEANRSLNSEDLKKIAQAYVERLGTYSNQANYQNFSDLKLLSTKAMQDWLEAYSAKLKANDPDSTVYYGLSSTALVGEVKSFDDTAGKAEILVTVERRETKTVGVEPTVTRQILRVDFLKVAGTWKVDGVYTQK